jgi:nitrite reductase (NADH) small subunit
MVQFVSSQASVTQWITVCKLSDILPDTGVCALVKGQQIAIFRVGQGADVYAIENYDPFSKANVLSRGIVGDRNGIPKVASPIYKQTFNLKTGECFDNREVRIATFAVRVVDNQIQIGVAANP